MPVCVLEDGWFCVNAEYISTAAPKTKIFPNIWPYYAHTYSFGRDWGTPYRVDRDCFASFNISSGDSVVAIQASYDNANWSYLHDPHPCVPGAWGTLQYGINLKSGTYTRVIGTENQSMPTVWARFHEFVA